MKNISKFLLIPAVCLLFSCRKDEPGKPPVTYPNYTALKAGNYWIYQQYEIDSNGNETALNKFDSCYVEKDTVINGNVYHKMVRPAEVGFWVRYLRDSLHYLVDDAGLVLFSSEDNRELLNKFTLYDQNDTLYHTLIKPEPGTEHVTTAAGSFETRRITTIHTFRPWLPGRTKVLRTLYSKNLGIVVETMPGYAMQPLLYERRLIRYSVK